MSKTCSFCKKIIFSLLISGFFSVLSAENFRVAKMHTVQIPNDYEGQSVEAGIFDGVSIELPEDKTFISGIELNIKVPDIVAQWRDTVAYAFYEDLAPAPKESIIDYSGTKLPIGTIPGKLNYTIYVPLTQKFSVKESPYAKILTDKISPSDNSIFFRFFLAMKGAPESLEYAKFEITVKPVLTDEGYFALNVAQPQGKKENFTVYIDDERNGRLPGKIILPSGEHHLSVTSEAYRNEVRTFIVEKTKTTKLDLELRGIEPTVKIVAPENSRIAFDGQPVTNTKEPFVVSQGEHTVKFTIGDYEVIKTVSAVNGSSYTISLNVDATVSEEQ